VNGSRNAATGFTRRDLIVSLVIVAASYVVFRHAPVHESGGDSRYTLLLSENLLRHRDLHLERYSLPTEDYRLRDEAGHRFYAFPVGTSLLSIPYVAMKDARGKGPVRSDGSFDLVSEQESDAGLSAILTAMFSGVIFLTARLLLPAGWSGVIALASAFGTQMLSTTSRGLWSDTWGILLAGLAAFLLLRSEVWAESTPFGWLGTLLASAYIVRPTNALVLVGAGVYLGVTAGKRSWRFLVAAVVWLALFAGYSWRTFHTVFPDYYRPGRLEFGSFGEGLVGTLISPSRGLLVCVPLLGAVAILVLRYRTSLRFRGLIVLASSLMAAHVVAVAGYPQWWGGHSFGARLTAGLVPWIVILEVLAVDAWQRAVSTGARQPYDIALLSGAGLLVALSIAINTVGAFSIAARDWNVRPNIDYTPHRLWSWRHAQVLAPFETTRPDAPPRESGQGR
jgi:hypothetical protein